MIVIVGESASGKSSLEKEFVRMGYENIVTYTTRPIRVEDREVDGVDYHFISKERFEEGKELGFFAETSKYNGWYYGIAKEDCLDDRVVVVNPFGFRQLQKDDGLNITSFYVKTSWRVRLKRMIDRGDALMEMFRRIVSDMGVFQGVEEEVSCVIENESYNEHGSLKKIVCKAVDFLKNIEQSEKINIKG